MLYIFNSKFAPYIKDFVALKRSNGFIYENEEFLLSEFDKFCFAHKNLDSGIITKELMDLWSIQKETENKNRRISRVSSIKQLGLYMQSIGKEAYISPYVGSKCQSVPYIPTFTDLQCFFHTLDSYKTNENNPKKQMVSIMYPVIFRLLFCCGLRISEATKIRREFVDLNKGTLTVYKSKGPKDRVVFMSPDLCKLCKNYDIKMHKLRPYSDYFFPGKEKNTPILNNKVQAFFHKLWSKSFPSWNKRFPTPHCLRHAFVVCKIERWIKDGEDIDVMMPYLSKYLGHSSINETYYYFHNLESIAPIIKEKDISFTKIIPEVIKYEK